MRWILLGVTGAASGMAVAAGLFTFLAITGVAQRLMLITHTSSYGDWYEWMLMAGGILGNILWLGHPTAQLGTITSWVVLGLTGGFVGLFVGCLLGAIAEVLNAFPVFMRRARLKRGIALIVIGIAIGKAVGVWFWYFMLPGEI